MTTQTDIPRIAATIRVAGELLEVHGELMLDLTSDWAAGAKAANLDPDSRGNRWETDDNGDVWAIPADPTGEAILHARSEVATELRKRLARMTEDAQWLRDMAHVLAPVALPSTTNARADAWCSHHLKVGLCEPRKNGSDRNTLCRWCSDFWALWQSLPPLSLVRDRHEGKRISVERAKAALEAEGAIVKEVDGVTKIIRQARRGRTGRPNQNTKRKAG